MFFALLLSLSALAFAVVASDGAGEASRANVIRAALAITSHQTTNVDRTGSDTLTEAVLRGLAHEAPAADRGAVAAAYAHNFTWVDDAEKEEGWLQSLFGPMTPSPEQVHLGLANGTGSRSVIWLTAPSTADGQACFSCGKEGFQSCVAARSYTYTPISVLPWQGRIHSAVITVPVGSADDSCTYRVGPLTDAANATLWSPMFSFSPIDFSDTHRDLFVALGGDMGTVQLFGYTVAAQMHDFDTSKRSFDAFWHLGDIAYSTLDPPKLNFEFFWDMYLRQEQSLLNHVPLLATYGNHDFSGGDSGAFINRFHNPREPYGGNGNFYFAARQGPVLYVSMCTEVALNPADCDYSPSSAQFHWLNRTFASINRTETPWLILAGHRPMYSSDRATDSGALQRYIEPLLLEHRVDLQLAGHMHCTELTTPVADNVAKTEGVTNTTPTSFVYSSPAAPVHVTAGTLGAVIKESFVVPAPRWSAVRAGTLLSNSYGFVTLNATRTSLHLEFHMQSTGETLWDVLITK